MGFFELLRIFLSEDEEIVIPINDEEESEYSCRIEIEETETIITEQIACVPEESNIQQILDLIEELPESPNGKPPKFEILEREAI